MRNRKCNLRTRLGRFGMPKSTHWEGLHLTIQENQPGPFGLCKMELLQGRDYLLSAFRPLQSGCENEWLYSTVLMKGALALTRKPGDIDPVMVRLGQGLYSSGNIYSKSILISRREYNEMLPGLWHCVTYCKETLDSTSAWHDDIRIIRKQMAEWVRERVVSSVLRCFVFSQLCHCLVGHLCQPCSESVVMHISPSYQCNAESQERQPNST